MPDNVVPLCGMTPTPCASAWLSNSLSPGKHSELIIQIIEEFVPRFTPEAQVMYVGDTGSKLGYFDHVTLKMLGVEVDSHGKMPDVVLHYKKKG